MKVIAVFGKVTQVRDYPSMGITRVMVEIPVEAHVAATQLLYDKNVLVTLAPPEMAKTPYGMRTEAEEEAEDSEPPVGSVERQAWQDSKNRAANAALDRISIATSALTKGGPLSELAGRWCKDPAFQRWIRAECPIVVKACPATMTAELVSRECILHLCQCSSRKDLDHNKHAKGLFEAYVRGPFMALSEAAQEDKP